MSEAKPKAPPAWILTLRAALDDPWEWFVAAVADSQPTEIDYVSENWTHVRIAREYARKVARANS